MKLYDKFSALMTAAAFAEECEFRTARELFEEAKAEALQTKPSRELDGTIAGTLATEHGK